MTKKLKILIVDDSLIFRGIVQESLQNEDDMQIVGSVRNGKKALEAIRANRPDLVTLDVDMPEMDGLQTLRAIQELNAKDTSKPPIGVIMLSAFTHKGADTTIEALEMGAFDFIAKPNDSDFEKNHNALKQKLIVKIRHFASQKNASKLPRPRVSSPPRRSASRSSGKSQVKAILIGVSTGGPRALIDMLPALCKITDLPICIVQHMPPTFTKSLASSLDARCQATVVEAGDQEVIQDNHVYIAPGGSHMLIHKKGTNILTILNQQEPENGCRPSVDVLFRSATSAYNGNVLAMVLTGMGVDGSKSLGALKRSGAYIIAQDEATSVVWGMPGSAVASGNVDEICPLMEIPQTVEAILNQPVA